MRLEVSIRYLIVDDNVRFLEAARASLERQGEKVAGIATTTDEALQQTEALRPDVVLVDISLGDESGFELARRLVGSFRLSQIARRVDLDARRRGLRRPDRGEPGGGVPLEVEPRGESRFVSCARPTAPFSGTRGT